jgi:hypothetical protein
MKTVAKRLAGLAAIMALATPTLAQAGDNPAAALSVSGGARASASPKGTSKLSGSTGTIVNIGILAALVVVLLVAVDSGGSDSPDSP